MSGLTKLVREIEFLKPMPQVANQILHIIEDPVSSTGEVAEIVQYDPAVTANILKICNSAYYGLPRQVDSVQEAISFLGLDQIIEIVLLKSGTENMRSEQAGYGLHEGDLWRHAISSALVAKELAVMKKIENKNLVFTAALLKDIGKVVLDRYVSDSFQKIMSLVDKDGFSFREAEKKVLGVDHAELGGIIAKTWKFSSRLIEMISNHHMQTEESRKDEETSIVYLADVICMMMGLGCGADGLAYRFHKEVLEHLEITELDLQKIIAGFGEKIKSVEDILEVV